MSPLPGQVRYYASAHSSPFLYVSSEQATSSAIQARAKQHQLVQVVDEWKTDTDHRVASASQSDSDG